MAESLTDVEVDVDVDVRKATIDDLDDLDALVALGNEIQDLHAHGRSDLFREVDSSALTDFFRERFEDGSHILVADRGNGPLGYLLAEHIVRDANPFKRASSIYYIHHIAVGQSSQSTGLGKRLMSAAADDATRLQASAIRLDSWHFNADAHEFFRAVGFSPVNIVFERNINHSI